MEFLNGLMFREKRKINVDDGEYNSSFKSPSLDLSIPAIVNPMHDFTFSPTSQSPRFVFVLTVSFFLLTVFALASGMFS